MADDLMSLVSALRGGVTNSPEPQPDLPGGQFSQAQATRWVAWRNAKIQAAAVPPNVKQAMTQGEDFGEGEIVPSQTDAQRNLMETEQRARAGARPGTPSITGAPPQPGRDIPLEYGLNPDNSGMVSSRPTIQPISAVGSALGTSQTLAASNDPALNPDEDTRIGVNAGNRFAATERGMELSGTQGQARDPHDPMPVATGRMNDLSPQPGGGVISAVPPALPVDAVTQLVNALRSNPQIAPLLARLGSGTAGSTWNTAQPQADSVAQIPASLQPPTRTLPGPGFIPGTLRLNEAIAPQVPVGAPRPFAPGEMVHNPDGSWSSEVSMTVSGDKSFNDGKPTIIPSLWIKNGLPYVAKDEDEAIGLAKQSGLDWPSYPSMDAAETASNARERIWQTVGTQNAHTISPLWSPSIPTIEPPAASGIVPPARAVLPREDVAAPPAIPRPPGDIEPAARAQ